MSLAEEEANLLQRIERENIDELILKEKYAKRLTSFLETLKSSSFKDKQILQDQVTAFLVDYLQVPAAYVAFKRIPEEDVEMLYYTSSNQSFLPGKKLLKTEFNEDEPVEREGIVFDAFILPEAPEEEDVDPDDENYVPPPAPKAQPLIVENTMREKRLKFFSIPQLGSFLAVPLSFQSIDHEEGCIIAEPEEVTEEEEETEAVPVPEPAADPAEGKEGEEETGRGDEEGEGKGDEVSAPVVAEKKKKEIQYAVNKRVVELVVCIDTVGNYRAISVINSTYSNFNLLVCFVFMYSLRMRIKLW